MSRVVYTQQKSDLHIGTVLDDNATVSNSRVRGCAGTQSLPRKGMPRGGDGSIGMCSKRPHEVLLACYVETLPQLTSTQ